MGKVSQEVRVRVTSTDGNQYQVFHRVLDPFTNDQGDSLGRESLVAYALPGSNASGTLYGQNVESLGFNDQLLYTSGSGGEGDTLTVVYMIDMDRIEAMGSFLARIQFVARPIGGGGQDTVILNASVDVEEELKITVEGSSVRDGVRLAFGRDKDEEGFVRFTLKGNLGRSIRIFQEVETYPQDELHDDLNSDVVMFAISGSEGGGAVSQPPAPLTRKRELIYSSTVNEDDFYVYLRLNQDAAERQKSGSYKGKLRYLVESESGQNVFHIDLEVGVDPVFSIQVDLPGGGLNFDRLLPEMAPVLREVDVRVVTNRARPYIVMQSLISPLTSGKGEEMPEGHFTVKEELLDGDGGQAADGDYQPVLKGERPLYFSDRKGSPAHFRVIYRLRPYSQMQPGDYSTSIRYSLGEM